MERSRVVGSAASSYDAKEAMKLASKEARKQASKMS